MKNKLLLSILALGVFLTGCSDNSINPDPPVIKTSSIYVINEGNFSDANGSITSFKPESGQAIQQLFQKVNGGNLTGIIQSVSEIDGKLFIALNSANKIEVVNAKTFISIATIPLTTDPFSVAPAANNRAYVTNLKKGSVSIINLETYEVQQKTIPVGLSPQNILTVGELTYVANNGYGKSNTISVIDNTKDMVIKTITVGNGPTDLELDDQGRIWVVCNGLLAYDDDWNRVPGNDVPGSIYVIDSQNATVVGSIELKGHPTGFAINGELNRGYLLNDGVLLVNTGTISVMNNKLASRTFNAVEYSSAEDMIYLAVNKGYTQPGKVIRFNTEGIAVDSFAVGIAPSGFYFNTQK